MEYTKLDSGMVLVSGYIDNSYNIEVTEEEAKKIEEAENILNELDARQYTE